jgi:RNA recognition motif-containing protein
LVQPGLTHLRLLTKAEREALLRSAKHQITSKFLNRNNNLNASDSDATTQYSNSTKKSFKKDARLFIANIPEDVTGATLYAFLIRHLDDEKDRAEIVSVRNRRQSFRPEYTTSSIASSSSREKSDAEVAAEQMTFDGFAFINVESERVRDLLLQKLNGVKWRGRKLRLDGKDGRPESDEKGAEEGKKEKKPRHKKLLRLAAEAEAAKLQSATASSEQSLAQAQVDTIVAKEALRAERRGERRGVSLSRAMSDIKSDVETPNRFDEENRRNDHSSSSSSSSNNYSNSKKLQEEGRSSMVEIDDFFSAPSPTDISAVRREKRVQQPIEEDLDTIDGFASNSTSSHKRSSRSSSVTEADRKGLVTLYVGNLSYQTSEEALRDFVQRKLQKMRTPVTVVHARIVTDGFSGRKRGFGYIDLKMPSKSSQDTTMKAVLKQLDEQQLDGRSLRVNPAEEHPKK